MFKSFAHVCLFTSLVAFAATAAGQSDGQTTSAAVKNHISDAERDRLMQEAMEKARAELEKSKAERVAREQVKKEREEQARREAAQAKAAAEREAAEATARKQADAEAKKKADEERMARELAEAEKKSSEKSRQEKPDAVKDLDDEKPEQASTKKAEESKYSKEAIASKPKTEKKDSDSSENKKTSPPAKTVIETVSTREPGSAISVKTTLPAGDQEREAEQRAARQAASAEDPDHVHASSESPDSHSYSGRVVGIMRSSGSESRILLQSEDSRMVQVMLGSNEVPAPGSVVSVRGRAIGGNSASPVISAKSVDIKSGEKMRPLQDVVAPQPILDAPPLLEPDPLMMPIMPMVAPPMPMGIGPLPGPVMGGPPPGFR